MPWGFSCLVEREILRINRAKRNFSWTDARMRFMFAKARRLDSQDRSLGKCLQLWYLEILSPDNKYKYSKAQLLRRGRKKYKDSVLQYVPPDIYKNPSGSYMKFSNSRFFSLVEQSDVTRAHSVLYDLFTPSSNKILVSWMCNQAIRELLYRYTHPRTKSRG